MSEAGSGCIFCQIDNACKCGNLKSYQFGSTCVAICEHARFQREYTKIVRTPCQDCGAEIELFCNESAKIIAVRCPACTQKFHEINPDTLSQEDNGGDGQ